MAHVTKTKFRKLVGKVFSHQLLNDLGSIYCLTSIVMRQSHAIVGGWMIVYVIYTAISTFAEED